jgi:hypothetical protein
MVQLQFLHRLEVRDQYQYTINGGATWEGTGSYINLVPGSYDVRIRDAVNTACMLILNANLVLTQPVILSATAARTNVTCHGASDGTITVSDAAGGSGSFEYTIDGGINWRPTGDFTGLGPGYYNVRIRDANNHACVIVINSSLGITEPAALNATVARTNITCNGANNGTITISSPTGGYGLMKFTIRGNTQVASSGSFTDLPPDTYDVRMRDPSQPACKTILNSTLTISEPAALAATLTYSNVTCHGAANGTISFTGAAGGSGTYEYTINGGTLWVGSGIFTNLSPGNYTVMLRDAVNRIASFRLDLL